MISIKQSNQQIGKWGFVILLAIFIAGIWFRLPTTAPSVSFSISDSWVTAPTQLHLATAGNAKIIYTLDGSIPTLGNGSVYEQPLILAGDDMQMLTVRARAYTAGDVASAITTKAYFINMGKLNLPIMSLVTDPAGFTGAESGIYTNHEARGREWERNVYISYISATRGEGFELDGGLRLHGGISREITQKKSFRLYFRDEYGAANLNYPLFDTQGTKQFNQLVVHNSGQDLKLYKNALMDNIMRKIGGYASRNRPILLFINGDFFGIYQLRERLNPRFFAANYGMMNTTVVNTPAHQLPDDPSVETWRDLIAFVREHELQVPENYQYVIEQIDIDNFIDYYLLNLYSVNLDWPFNNVTQFHAQGERWQWATWDNDLAFASPNVDAMTRARTLEHQFGEPMVMFFNALLENATFRERFEQRSAELLNGILSPQHVIEEIDRVSAEIAPDVYLEKQRWSISQEWELALAEMKAFADARPAIMQKNITLNLEQFQEE